MARKAGISSTTVPCTMSPTRHVVLATRNWIDDEGILVKCSNGAGAEIAQWTLYAYIYRWEITEARICQEVNHCLNA